MLIPKLRSEEAQFLLAQSSSELAGTEGIPVPTEAPKLVQALPVRWRRCHMIFVSLMLIFPLMVMLEFSYGELFGTYNSLLPDKSVV